LDAVLTPLSSNITRQSSVAQFHKVDYTLENVFPDNDARQYRSRSPLFIHLNSLVCGTRAQPSFNILASPGVGKQPIAAHVYKSLHLFASGTHTTLVFAVNIRRLHGALPYPQAAQ
jgi:hypothetical protein